MNNPNKINELELAVRTIEEMLPDMPTASLQKWQGIFKSALAKVEKEMTTTYLHTCHICFFQEYGYRDESPSAWYRKGDAEICFQHDYSQAERLLKEAGREVDAFFPPETATPSVKSLAVMMEDLPPPPEKHEQSLEELMALI